jgi:hypothetical protein
MPPTVSVEHSLLWQRSKNTNTKTNGIGVGLNCRNLSKNKLLKTIQLCCKKYDTKITMRGVNPLIL